ncbi:secretion protein snm4 [Streptomyces sp. NPDC058773]|uniref:secretion protein snm4 n=1 Tax=Streptomyces sp. NPDC058773 TaxID=3346632 RepID=UPI0036B5AD6A
MARGYDGRLLKPDDAAGRPDSATRDVTATPDRDGVRDLTATPDRTGTRDLPDAVAAPLDIRGWGWGERTRGWAAVTASVLLAAITGVCAASWYPDGGVALWLGAAAVLVTAAGAAVGTLTARHGQHAPGAALLLLGGVLGVAAAWQAVPGGAARLAAVGLTVAAVLALLGLRTGPVRGGLTGAASLALAVGVWELGLALTAPARTGVVVGFVSVLVLGQLPRLALRTAGLTRLDDLRSGGTPVSRHRVAGALGAGHRELVPATTVAAVSAGAAGVVAVQSPGLWTVLAALLLCGLLCSRARAYPLAVEVVALLAAGVAVCVRLVVLWATDGGAPAAALSVLGLLAVLPVAVLAVRVPEATRARLRRWLDLAESAGVVALIPVTLGAFGLYGSLFGAS